MLTGGLRRNNGGLFPDNFTVHNFTVHNFTANGLFFKIKFPRRQK